MDLSTSLLLFRGMESLHYYGIIDVLSHTTYQHFCHILGAAFVNLYLYLL